MNTLDLLTTRRSTKQLTTPGPNQEQIALMLQAATQVPDHGLLLPFRFVVITGESALQRLSDTLVQAVDELALGEEGMKKAERIGNMAPTLIAVLAAAKADNAIPVWEQHLTAGCAAYAIQLAAKAQGFDSVWLSGKWVDSESLREAFACKTDDKIIALLPIGTAKSPVDEAKNTELDDLVQYW